MHSFQTAQVLAGAATAAAADSVAVVSDIQPFCHSSYPL